MLPGLLVFEDGRADDDDMNEASGGESQPEIKDDGAHSDTNADTEPAVGNDDMEAFCTEFANVAGVSSP